ncbi:hypothetical protein L249_0189, partial [Ophiocordyceps polyrhachis-furcata BCC 54312]
PQWRTQVRLRLLREAFGAFGRGENGDNGRVPGPPTRVPGEIEMTGCSLRRHDSEPSNLPRPPFSNPQPTMPAQRSSLRRGLSDHKRQCVKSSLCSLLFSTALLYSPSLHHSTEAREWQYANMHLHAGSGGTAGVKDICHQSHPFPSKSRRFSQSKCQEKESLSC